MRMRVPFPRPGECPTHSVKKPERFLVPVFEGSAEAPPAAAGMMSCEIGGKGGQKHVSTRNNHAEIEGEESSLS
jgi:hypothetical protein